MELLRAFIYLVVAVFWLSVGYYTVAVRAHYFSVDLSSWNKLDKAAGACLMLLGPANLIIFLDSKDREYILKPLWKWPIISVPPPLINQ